MIFKFTYTNVIYVLLYFHWHRGLCALHGASIGVNWKPLFENVVMHSENRNPTISGIKFHSPRGHYLVTILLTRSQSDPRLKMDIVCFREWIFLRMAYWKKKVSNSKFLYLKLWQILHKVLYLVIKIWLMVYVIFLSLNTVVNPLTLRSD